MTEAPDILFNPFTLGDLHLPNRIIMAPLTRSRAKQPGDIPWELNSFAAENPGIKVTCGRDLSIDPKMLAASKERMNAVSTSSPECAVPGAACLSTRLDASSIASLN